MFALKETALLWAALHTWQARSTPRTVRLVLFPGCDDFVEYTAADAEALLKKLETPQPIKVQVVVQGDLVVNVGANVPLEVEVIDLDNKDCGFEASSDFDENGVVEDGSWWVCSVESWPVEQVGMLYQVRDREGADD